MHEIVNRRAAELAPGAAGEAWRPLAHALGAHASDADHRKSTHPDERPRHFIDIDAWDSHPFDDVPRSFDELVRKHGREKATEFGVVPWAIGECYEMVVLSLRRGDWGSAGAWAADLGHYVADSHQPLHCTLNYDGQSTGNDGVHIRFEVTMMNRFFREESIVAAVSPADPEIDPVESCFSWIAEAYPGVETILAADDAARGADSDLGNHYYEVLWERSGDAARRQMQAAVRDLAQLYAAAWEEAGRPAPTEPPPAFRAIPVEALSPPPEPDGPSSGKAWLAAALAVMTGFLVQR